MVTRESTRLLCFSCSPRTRRRKHGGTITDGCTGDSSTTQTKTPWNLPNTSFQDLVFSSYITKNVSDMIC